MHDQFYHRSIAKYSAQCFSSPARETFRSDENRQCKSTRLLNSICCSKCYSLCRGMTSVGRLLKTFRRTKGTALQVWIYDYPSYQSAQSQTLARSLHFSESD